MNFGLPPIKQEGMCFSYEHPELSWDGYRREFNEYFKTKYNKWYFKPVKSLLLKVAGDAWSEALFTNAKKEYDGQNA